MVIDLSLIRQTLAPILDFAIVYYLIYRLILNIKGTRAVPMLFGLLGILVFYALSKEEFLALSTFNWLLEEFIGSLFLIVVVVFQADIRRALTAFGRTQFLTTFGSSENAQLIDELVKASVSLARQQIGALMVIERRALLDPYIEEATRLDARVSKELLYAIFVPERQNPLHDGAVVIQQGRISAAGVFLPMSVNPKIARNLGTRHRAALGLSEEIDALIIVISEERGAVSLAHEGALMLDLSTTALRDKLTHYIIRPSKDHGRIVPMAKGQAE
ncbi:diadenylate cyclase CdaA [Myxococcota bacterium]|nr:diadenylate cyclase CdaA [Myxococcota bacterium]MBU1433110.1 diadenylate cyclase CdaA [Myxococcota bacterium]MBU1900261.1 diadenylate cyclase CdaA [Myxococcota bacterium]